jgi:hypothetical protein
MWERSWLAHIPFDGWSEVYVRPLSLLDPRPNVLIYYVLHSRGFSVSCGLEAFAMVCSLVLWASYRMDNARRDGEYGLPDPDATVDTSELADKVNVVCTSTGRSLTHFHRRLCSGIYLSDEVVNSSVRSLTAGEWKILLSVLYQVLMNLNVSHVTHGSSRIICHEP